MCLVIRVDIHKGMMKCTERLKHWDVVIDIATQNGISVQSSVIELPLELVIDYETKRSLDVWHEKRKNHKKLFALSDPNPLTVNIENHSFLAKTERWQLLQMPIIQFCRFAIWACFERGCSPKILLRKDQVRCIKMYEQLADYFSRCISLETTRESTKKGKRIIVGEKIQFSLRPTESLVLSALLAGGNTHSADNETLLIQQCFGDRGESK